MNMFDAKAAGGRERAPLVLILASWPVAGAHSQPLEKSPEEQSKASQAFSGGSERKRPHLPGFTQVFCDLSALLDIANSRQQLAASFFSLRSQAAAAVGQLLEGQLLNGQSN